MYAHENTYTTRNTYGGHTFTKFFVPSCVLRKLQRNYGRSSRRKLAVAFHEGMRLRLLKVPPWSRAKPTVYQCCCAQLFCCTVPSAVRTYVQVVKFCAHHHFHTDQPYKELSQVLSLLRMWNQLNFIFGCFLYVLVF